MKGSITIIVCFIIGILAGSSSLLPDPILETDLSIYVLYALLFLVGIGVGSDPRAWHIIRKIRLKILLVPGSVIFGTYLGVIPCALLFSDITIRDALAVGSGFGYYSLSSIIINELRGEVLGTIALFSNILREIFTLIATPVLAKYLGKLSPIASGGATSMDTTLPVIAKFTGKQYVMIALFSGFALTILVPFLVTLLLS
ncbi:MAG: lysine exporter LysO family protein [Thermodesulfobacteriota bacterium]|nr:lysine exporter LysO family protein [Thermodesulfobacteriota bacterium]